MQEFSSWVFEYALSVSATAILLCLWSSDCLLGERYIQVKKNCYDVKFMWKFDLTHYVLLCLPNLNICVLDSELQECWAL